MKDYMQKKFSSEFTHSTHSLELAPALQLEPFTVKLVWFFSFGFAAFVGFRLKQITKVEKLRFMPVTEGYMKVIFMQVAIYRQLAEISRGRKRRLIVIVIMTITFKH